MCRFDNPDSAPRFWAEAGENEFWRIFRTSMSVVIHAWLQSHTYVVGELSVQPIHYINKTTLNLEGSQ